MNMKNIPGTEMISKHKNGYQIYTDTRSNKRKYYAITKTLIQALMVRDYGIATNWMPFPKIHTSKTHEPYIHKRERGYCIIKEIKGKLHYFGIFDKLEDAIDERDLLIEFDWDIDKLCECVEEGNSWINKAMKSSYQKRSHYDTFYNW